MQPTTYSHDFIDIHDTREDLNRAIARLSQDPAIREEHRRAILRFVSDCRCGRATDRRGRKRISDGRCLKLLYALRRIALTLDVPFEDVRAEHLERFITGIETGTISKLTAIGGTLRYTPESVLDFKKILRRFYRWLLGTCDRLHDLTGWIDTGEPPRELVTFDLPAAQAMARAIGSPQGQALVLGLFDGGFRAGECFNLRLRDLSFRPDADGVLTCFAKIRHSKTSARTVALPIATDAIRFWVERHPNGGPVQSDGQIAAKDPHAQMIVWSYHTCRKLLAQVGREELNQRLYFHRFRHSSATWYARILTPYQLCARYGWRMGSDVVARYVDASGVMAEDAAHLARRGLADLERRHSVAKAPNTLPERPPDSGWTTSLRPV
jgi:integrase